MTSPFSFASKQNSVVKNVPFVMTLPAIVVAEEAMPPTATPDETLLDKLLNYSMYFLAMLKPPVVVLFYNRRSLFSIVRYPGNRPVSGAFLFLPVNQVSFGKHFDNVHRPLGDLARAARRVHDQRLRHGCILEGHEEHHMATDFGEYVPLADVSRALHDRRILWNIPRAIFFGRPQHTVSSQEQSTPTVQALTGRFLSSGTLPANFLALTTASKSSMLEALPQA